MAVINKKFLFVILVLLVYFAQSEIGAETLSTNLSVAVDASVIPYCFFDDTGLMRGIMVDMLDEIAKTENLNVKYSIYNSYDACFEALSKAQVDMILGGANVDTSDKSFRSLLLMSSSLCAVASSDIADEIESGNITLYTVAMDYNSKKISSQYMSMNSRIGGNLTKVVADQEVLFQSFLAGKEDLAVADKESIKYLLAQNEITSQYRIIFNYLAPTDYSLVVRSDNPSLYRRMRSGVEHLRASGNLERIIERWTEDKSGIILSNIMIRRIAGIGILITIIVVAYIVLNFLMNRELRKKVAEKTRDINLANQALEDKVQKLHNEGMLRTKIIENSPTAMVLLNEDLVISYMNRSTVEITGAAASNSIGLNIKDLKIFNELFKTTPEELFSEEDYNVYRNESVELPAMGRIQYYRYTIYKLLGGDDKLNYLLSVENITEHEREKQAIFEVEKNKTLNTLIASIAHEIKNPLMSIYNYSVLIPRQMKNAEFRESFVNTVPEEVNRIRRLIDSLINYAKPAKGQREYLNLLPVVKDCIRLTRPSTEKKGIDVTVDVEDNLIIYMDKDKLKQCLVNLIINSMDSIVQKNETGGKAVSGIRIEGIKAESYTGISVSDDGCGMTEDELENCISPFYTTKQKGTGLGISIIKRIVEDNGGEIIIESKKDQYTKVTLKFY